ncbi:holo-ACP synthase [Runella zeae]|uniref:holo-ACP synthase n=1 Tax=Runella zeae TaxID=94255 RepID=UPI002352A832|nr:holo-ACP synthase [Runella zeae]
MVVGIGCDIVEHKITKSLNWESDPEVLNRIFSQNEMDLYKSYRTIKYISGRFAAKEAILKCLGRGMQDGISMRNIQILQSKDGKPFIKLSGSVKKISDRMGVNLWHITITHSTDYSLAFVIAESI